MADKKIISSVKVKSVGCNPKVAAALEESNRVEIRLARFMGVITGLQFGETETGDYIALTGRFRVENMQSNSEIDGKPVEAFGNVYESGVCFLPPGMMESIIGKCRSAGVIEPEKSDLRSKKVDKALVKEVNFAVDVFVRRDSNASGITYACKELLAPTESDPLEEIARAIVEVELKLVLAAGSGGKQKQIAAPETAPAKGKDKGGK